MPPEKERRQECQQHQADINELKTALAVVTQKIDSGFDAMSQRIAEFSLRTDKVNETQFTEIGLNRERIKGIETNTDYMKAKMDNGGIKATALVRPDKSMGLFDTIKSIQAKWLLIIFCGGGGVFLLMLDIIIDWLEHLRLSLGAALPL